MNGKLCQTPVDDMQKKGKKKSFASRWKTEMQWNEGHFIERQISFGVAVDESMGVCVCVWMKYKPNKYTDTLISLANLCWMFVLFVASCNWMQIMILCSRRFHLEFVVFRSSFAFYGIQSVVIPSNTLIIINPSIPPRIGWIGNFNLHNNPVDREWKKNNKQNNVIMRNASFDFTD